MNHDKLIIRPANTNDAPRILKHLKTVGDESDFLTFNSAYIKITVEEEEEIGLYDDVGASLEPMKE